jgi:hypothetical protein
MTSRTSRATYHHTLHPDTALTMTFHLGTMSATFQYDQAQHLWYLLWLGTISAKLGIEYDDTDHIIRLDGRSAHAVQSELDLTISRERGLRKPDIFGGENWEIELVNLPLDHLVFSIQRCKPSSIQVRVRSDSSFQCDTRICFDVLCAEARNKGLSAFWMCKTRIDGWDASTC